MSSFLRIPDSKSARITLLSLFASKQLIVGKSHDFKAQMIKVFTAFEFLKHTMSERPQNVIALQGLDLKLKMLAGSHDFIAPGLKLKSWLPRRATRNKTY